MSSTTDTHKDFANVSQSRVQVLKWNDLNNDGVRNFTRRCVGDEDCVVTFTEPVISGWPLFVGEQYKSHDEGTVEVHIISSGVTNEDGVVTAFLPEEGSFLVLEGAQSGWNRTYPTGTGVFGIDRVVVTLESGVTVPSGFTVDTGTYFAVSSWSAGQTITVGNPARHEEPTVALQFGNFFTPVVVVPPQSGGGNGPIAGTFGVSNPNGLVLGVSTTTINPFIPSSTTASPTLACERVITEKMGANEKNPPAQVQALQTLLRTFENADIPTSEDGVYGPKTLSAVKAFQLKYADEILKPWGLTAPTGITYLTTRLKLNNMYCAGKGVFTLTPEEQKIIDRYKASQSRPAPRPIVFETPAPDNVPTVVIEDATTTLEVSTSSSGFWPTLRSWFGGSN